MDKLTLLRRELNSLDEEILSILNRRMEIAEEIGRTKTEEHLPLLDSKREEWVVKKAQLLSIHPILQENIVGIFKAIMECAKDVQALCPVDRFPFKKIGLIGLGLMGGSLAKAIKHKDPSCELSLLKTSYDEEVPCELIDYTFDSLETLLPQIELLILATPIEVTTQIAKELLKRGTRVKIVDIMSVKKPFLSDLNGLDWVSTHPMAGKLTPGFEQSSSTLFVNRPWILLKEDASVRKLVESLGGLPVLIEETTHDQLAALISHLPTLLASLLLEFIKQEHSQALDLAGPTLKGMVRSADESPKLKEECFRHNQIEIDSILRRYLDFINEKTP